MTPKKDAPVKSFTTAEKWTEWLAKNHGNIEGIWLKVYKKDSGVPSLTITEALDEALCYGWIDGQRKGFDDKAYLQKYTPRRKGSIWSKVNQDKVLRLIREKRMQAPGLKAIEEAKQNGRWKNAYSLNRATEIPKDLQAALKAEPEAAEFFKTLKSQNRYAILFRIQNCKRAETRQKRIETFVDMLKTGKTIYPEKKKGTP